MKGCLITVLNIFSRFFYSRVVNSTIQIRLKFDEVDYSRLLDDIIVFLPLHSVKDVSKDRNEFTIEHAEFFYDEERYNIRNSIRVKLMGDDIFISVYYGSFLQTNIFSIQHSIKGFINLVLSLISYEKKPEFDFAIHIGFYRKSLYAKYKYKDSKISIPHKKSVIFIDNESKYIDIYGNSMTTVFYNWRYIIKHFYLY